MYLNIRPATESDMPEVLSLIKELAAFEKEPNAVIITTKDLINHACLWVTLVILHGKAQRCI